MWERRLERLPRRLIAVRGGASGGAGASERSPTEGASEVPVAVGVRARLLGLALLGRDAADAGLLIPRCSAVHTFGMRFALDFVFLDAEGRPLAVHRSVPRRRLVRCRGAAAVLETPAGAPRRRPK